MKVLLTDHFRQLFWIVAEFRIDCKLYNLFGPQVGPQDFGPKIKTLGLKFPSEAERCGETEKEAF